MGYLITGHHFCRWPHRSTLLALRQPTRMASMAVVLNNHVLTRERTCGVYPRGLLPDGNARDVGFQALRLVSVGVGSASAVCRHKMNQDSLFASRCLSLFYPQRLCPVLSPPPIFPPRLFFMLSRWWEVSPSGERGDRLQVVDLALGLNSASSSSSACGLP